MFPNIIIDYQIIHQTPTRKVVNWWKIELFQRLNGMVRLVCIITRHWSRIGLFGFVQTCHVPKHAAAHTLIETWESSLFCSLRFEETGVRHSSTHLPVWTEWFSNLVGNLSVLFFVPIWVNIFQLFCFVSNWQVLNVWANKSVRPLDLLSTAWRACVRTGPKFLNDSLARVDWMMLICCLFAWLQLLSSWPSSCASPPSTLSDWWPSTWRIHRTTRRSPSICWRTYRASPTISVPPSIRVSLIWFRCFSKPSTVHAINYWWH